MVRKATPGSRRSGKGGKAKATRALLLDAAVKVIGRKGYTGATVDEIVEEAGVSKGLAYYHFKSKAEMAASILDDGIGKLADEFVEIAARADTGPAALVGMIERFAVMIFENKEFGRFFVSELWREGRVWSSGMRENEERLLGLIRGQLQHAKDDGFIRPDIDVDFEAVALVGMVLTTSLYYIDERGTVSKETFIANIIDFVRHANVSAE